MSYNEYNSEQESGQPDLIAPADVIDAFIDFGYKSTDFALAEILDNSIEAGAKNVHILIVQAIERRVRSVWQVNKIAILDDGCGMAPELLSKVLTFGYGTHLKTTDKIGSNAFGKMGKYGVGLPNSSISQCDETKVYSWLAPDQVYVSELSIPKIRNRERRGQTLAKPSPVPKYLCEMMAANQIDMPSTGTVVLWENLERVNWLRSSSIIDHIEATVGRIYRKFIHDNSVRITISVFNDNDFSQPVIPLRNLRPNDPLFLMDNCIADDLIDQKKAPIEGTLFKPYPVVQLDNKDFFIVPVEQPDGTEIDAVVSLKFSITDPALRRAPYGGNSRIGCLANDNYGISICRSGRELQMIKSWIRETDPRNRWWGCEIDFPPALDSLFGVINNKQSATKLASFGNNFDVDAFIESYRLNWIDSHPSDKDRIFTVSDIIRQMQADKDLTWVMLFIVYVVQETKKGLRERIDVMKESSLKTRSLTSETKRGSASDEASREIHPTGHGVSKFATQQELEPTKPVTDKEKQDEMIKSVTAKEVYSSEDERLEDIKNFKNWLESDEQVLFRVINEPGMSAFFDGKYDQETQRIIVLLNSAHPAYSNIFESISFLSENEDVGRETINDNKNKMVLMRKSLALLLFTWIAYEYKENFNKNQRLMVKHARENWGMKLESILIELNKDQDQEGD